jgi:methyl coenzyme M reductase subunit C
MEVNQPMEVETKTTENKVRSGVNWPGALRQKGAKKDLDKAFVFVVSLSPSRKMLI